MFLSHLNAGLDVHTMTGAGGGGGGGGALILEAHTANWTNLDAPACDFAKMREKKIKSGLMTSRGLQEKKKKKKTRSTRN